jgi:hypothetical protein
MKRSASHPVTMTDQLSPQTSSSGDQLALIAHFLDELDLKTPIRPLAKETDSNTALLDTINSLVAVVRVIYP